MKKLCDYGCGQEAKHYFKTSGKWCCENHWLKCKNQRNRFSGEGNPFYSKSHTKEYKKKRSEIYKGKNNPRYGRECSKETKSKMRNSIKLTIKQIKERFPFFSKIEEMRYNPDKPLEEKEIQVHCKNHNCPNSKEKGGWFTPTSSRFKNRKDWLENEGKDICYFYCSQKCKDTCPLFHLKSDPFKNTDRTYTQQEYETFREFVLERDNYKCQYCGELAIDVHHERPQKLEPFFALDPDFAWSCCKECHYKYGHPAGSECSTGNLAAKIC